MASEVVQRPPPPVRRSSSSGGGRHFAAGSSTTSIASTVATKRRLSKTDGLTSSVTSSSTASKRGYNCCSKREKSSALAALIGCISLASLMTGLVTDLWVNTDEWIPSAAGSSGSEKLDASQAELPNLQPRSQQEASDRIDHRYNQQEIKRVHFAVGLWTVCPSHPDNHLLKGKPSRKQRCFFFKKKSFCVQYGCPFHSSHEPTDHLDPLGGGYKCTTLTKKERKSSLKFFSLHGCCCLRKTSKYLINVFATSSLDERVLQSSQTCLSWRQFVSVYLVLFSCRTFLFPRGSVPSFATRRNDVKLSKPRTTLVYANNE